MGNYNLQRKLKFLKPTRGLGGLGITMVVLEDDLLEGVPKESEGKVMKKNDGPVVPLSGEETLCW